MDIVSKNNNQVCKLCAGQGYVLRPSKSAVQARDPKRKFRTMETIECFCKRVERVERRYPPLRRRPDDKKAPLTEEDVLKIAEGKFKFNEGVAGNYLLYGNSEQFYRLVKASFLYLIQDPSARFFLGTGYEVIKDYYVGADDRNEFMALLNEFDLVVLMFDSNIVNKALKPVMVDLIKARLRSGLATWVWSERELEQSSEWSEDLVPFLKDQTKYTYNNLTPTVKSGNSALNAMMGTAIVGMEEEADA